MQECVVTIINRLGMHARASAKFVTAANTFKSSIQLCKDEVKVDGKSITGIMMLAVAKGDKVTICAEGSDEIEAIQALATLIGAQFGEEGCGS